MKHKDIPAPAGKTNWKGHTLIIENLKGSTRKGINPDGTSWETFMHHPYGFLVGTEGADNEGLDVYVGPNPNHAPFVYVVKQHKIDEIKKWPSANCGSDVSSYSCPKCHEHVWDCNCLEYWDEDKVFIGFDSKQQVKCEYLKQYDSPLFLGPILTFTVSDFLKSLPNCSKEHGMIQIADPVQSKLTKTIGALIHGGHLDLATSLIPFVQVRADANSGYALLNRPAMVISNAMELGDIDPTVGMFVWNDVVSRMGEKANYAGAIVFFVNSWLKRNQEGKFPPLPQYLAPSSLRIKAANQIQIPKAQETLEQWKKENDLTNAAVNALDLTLDQCSSSIKGLDEQIRDLTAKIDKYRGTSSSFAKRIPKWQKQIYEATQLKAAYRDRIDSQKALLAQATQTPTTTVSYEKMVQAIVQGLSKSQALEALSNMSAVLKTLRAELEKAPASSVNQCGSCKWINVCIRDFKVTPEDSACEEWAKGRKIKASLDPSDMGDPNPPITGGLLDWLHRGLDFVSLLWTKFKVMVGWEKQLQKLVDLPASPQQ